MAQFHAWACEAAAWASPKRLHFLNSLQGCLAKSALCLPGWTSPQLPHQRHALQSRLLHLSSRGSWSTGVSLRKTFPRKFSTRRWRSRSLTGSSGRRHRVILRETEPGSLAYAFDEDDEEEEMQGQDTAASSSRTRGKRNKIVKIPGHELSDNEQDQAGEAPRQEAPQPRTQDRFALDETKGTPMFPQTSSTEACRPGDSATDFFYHSCGDVTCSLCRVDGHGCSCSAQFLTHEGATGPGLVREGRGGGGHQGGRVLVLP